MIKCPACGANAPEDSRFCPACAAPLEDLLTTAPAATPAPRAAAPRSSSQAPARASSSFSGGAASVQRPASRLSGTAAGGAVQARFAPGAILGGRYRIVAIIGKGGMGEVYRADDLVLAQPVALKFLPEDLAKDPEALARFLGEVRTARQVSHNNVCRVYDVGEADGLTFLSMEYIDGEDLASLLRRIGRLPGDKAIEISRQLCAGLSAAHREGVLHRDLKPANVMLDGRGRAVITDFGLAGLAGQIDGAEVRSGTPAYMAPEQLAGKEVTEQSDIYSLGLVLYEIFTGKRAFEAKSLANLLDARSSTPPSRPSSIVKEMDPAVERVILRCLEPLPSARPASALAVAAALPGEILWRQRWPREKPPRRRW